MCYCNESERGAASRCQRCIALPMVLEEDDLCILSLCFEQEDGEKITVWSWESQAVPHKRDCQSSVFEFESFLRSDGG